MFANFFLVFAIGFLCCLISFSNFTTKTSINCQPSHAHFFIKNFYNLISLNHLTVLPKLLITYDQMWMNCKLYTRNIFLTSWELKLSWYCTRHVPFSRFTFKGFWIVIRAPTLCYLSIFSVFISADCSHDDVLTKKKSLK